MGFIVFFTFLCTSLHRASGAYFASNFPNYVEADLVQTT